jgi:hypothetical protein
MTDNNGIITDASTSNMTTDNDGIIVNASTSIPNEESIQAQTTTQPRSATPINTMANNYGNVFNPFVSILHKELIGAQATIELDSSVSVEPFPSPIGERLLYAASINNSPTTPIQDQAAAQLTVQPSSANQHHRNKPSNAISSQDGAAVENNDSDVNASSGIQQWESNSAAATKQQLYSVEIMHASPGSGLRLHKHQSNEQNLKGLLDRQSTKRCNKCLYGEPT